MTSPWPQGTGVPQQPPAFAALEWPGDVRDAAAGPWWWGLAIALGLLLGFTSWWQAVRRRRPPPAAAATARATALAKLRALPLPAAPGAAAAFYAELKTLVRLHCQERFGLRAHAATSEELLRSVPRSRELSPCLQACDRVLFAAHEPAASEPAAHREAAITFAQAGGEAGAP